MTAPKPSAGAREIGREAKHTPGPWKYSVETKDWAIVTNSADSIIANVNTETGPDSSSAPATRKMPSEANARLIAAAPELLEACKWLTNALDDKLGRELISIPVPIEEAMRQAIAKAEGKP